MDNKAGTGAVFMPIKTALPKIISVAVVLFALSFNKLYAQQKPDCANAQTQLEINLCAQQQFVAADKILNQVYQKALASLNSKQRTALIIAQKKWLLFKNADADLQRVIYAGGSMAPLAILNVKTASTRYRTAQLQTLLKDINR